MLKKVFSQSFIYGIGPQIPKFAGLLILPIISKDLTAKDFGLYGIIVAYGQALLYLKTLGTEIVLSNSYFKHPKNYKTFWRHISGMLHVWSFILAILLAIIILIVLRDEQRAMEIALLNALPMVLFSTTENLFFRYYQLQQRPIPISTRVMVTGLFNIAVTFYTIHYLKMGYVGWFYGSFVASAIGFLWMIYPIYIKGNFYPIMRLRWQYLKRTLKISLPVLPHFYGNYLLSSSDRVVMDILQVPTANIGKYNAANIVGNYVTLIATASRKAVGPMLQAFYAKENWNKAKELVIYWQISFLIGTTLLSIWLKDLIPFFIRTKDIGPIHSMTVWLVMAANYIPIYGGANSQLLYFEKTNQLWKRAMIAFAVNIILNLIFVPLFGVYAAAVNTFIAYMFLGYSSYFMKVYHQSKKMELYPLRWLLITLVTTGACLLIVELDVIYKAAITVLLLSGLFIFFQRFMKMRRESYKAKTTPKPS